MLQPVDGVLQYLPRGGGFLRDPDLSFQPGSSDVWVSSKLIREHDLPEGARIKGNAASGEKRLELRSVDSICDLKPDAFRKRTRFKRLRVINPQEQIRLGNSGNTSMRIVELIAPIGRGTRGLIVAQPKTGKTQILEDLAKAIHDTEPETRIIVLLIDERPEEVTHFQRNVDAEVLASSSDQSIESHINLAELTMAHIRCELECGYHIVLLLDSITRMARAFNISGPASNKIMSGGLASDAMEIPRRFFGLARNIENSGSVTVIATAQVETGSRMDDFIFQEFKSTGNSEIVLDRSLAEARIFPAINVQASGTRREELLCSEAEMEKRHALRRWLAESEPKEAIQRLLKLTSIDTTNQELLQRFIKKVK